MEGGVKEGSVAGQVESLVPGFICRRLGVLGELSYKVRGIVSRLVEERRRGKKRRREERKGEEKRGILGYFFFSLYL